MADERQIGATQVQPEAPLLEVSGLRLALRTSGHPVVDDANFTLAPGEVLGIVGESGSGKTMLVRSLMRLEPPAIERTAGAIRFKGIDLTALSPRQIRSLRGREIGMVFQEPMTSLNPAMTIGKQLEEGLRLHAKLDRAGRRERILGILKRVGIRDPEGAIDAYPHQFSGGMRQRIMLASVMLLRPALLIADEPTTALDTVVQREVLELMLELTREFRTAVLMISHDLPMVAHYTHRVVVMEQGKVVEAGLTEDVLNAPRHPYTRKLLSALPQRLPARQLANQPALLEVRDVVVDYAAHRGMLPRRKGAAASIRALHGISLSVRQGEVVAVVGGSGSGKTTLGRVISGMLAPTSGSVLFQGAGIDRGSAGYSLYRENCQMIFQDPYSSLDPRMKISALILEGLGPNCRLDKTARERRLRESLADVELAPQVAERYPHELSGGQRQRVAIARALIRRPSFVVADEPVSALDMTVRARVLALFSSLQEKYGFACLFVSHDLAVVEQIADRVIVMHQGHIVESGTRDAIFDTPGDSYTKTLLLAVPRLEPSEFGGVRLFWHTAESRNTDASLHRHHQGETP